MIYARLDNSQRPHSRQCAAKILPAARLACAVEFSRTGTPSGTSNALRIGPTIFFWHHTAECRACAVDKYAVHKACIVKTGTAQPVAINLSIAHPAHTHSGLNNARNVKSGHRQVPNAVNCRLNASSQLEAA